MRIGQIRFVFMPRKQLIKPDCLKQRCIDGLRKSADAHAELHPLADDRQQRADRHAGPDLRLGRVLAVAAKRLDAPMPLDPLEEQLRPPAVLAELCDGQRGQAGVAGQKRQDLVTLSVNMLDAPQRVGIALDAVGSGEPAAQVADHALLAVVGMRVQPSELRVGLGLSKQRPWKRRQAQVNGR